MITSAARPRGQQGVELDEADPDFRIPRRGRPPNATQARRNSALFRRTRALWAMVEGSAEGILDMNKAWMSLGVRIRSVLDITNVLMGAGVLFRTSKYTVQSTGPDLKAKLGREVQILEDAEKKLDELIETALEHVDHMWEDEISEKFLYLSYEDVKTIPSLREQTVILVKAPAETVLEVPHPAESIQLFLKSSQGPIDVYLSSEDHSPFDVPEDPQDDDDDDEPTDCSDDDGPMEHTQTPSFLSMSSTDAVEDLCSSTVTMEQLPPLANESFPPSPSPLSSLLAPTCSSDGEETPSFATLTTPLALSLGGEEYLLSLGEDEGISYPFSSVELEGGLWKCFAPADLPP
ncbi:transcription factor E2F3 [Gadus chalcogrammus]|uniref:transcription factor E2F3 n=1 Tax=Gadus chalcogrammus TaxID=1042646 RepID=UPI0024C49CF4|nr:transcription factor E2F3 [Gadus chalcogrammus]